ncbi:MAG: class I SAM-dependent methyltransferase [Actinobacteria bacterium]|nr:class I SAM-dependent methyltransferase [Actinomycetota bacterium]MCA1721442.1 class I SAM-dependent methyltransferase [Actinomycetota bacterium]
MKFASNACSYMAMTSAEAVELTREQIHAHDDQRDLGDAGGSALQAACREVFASASRLLDAGGGSGLAVPALLTAAPVVVVVDWSLTMLAAAEGRARLRCAGDLRRLPFADATFDGVHAAYAIQNLAEWQQAIAECVRVCRRAGPVVVAWGGPPADDRLAGIEHAYFSAVGEAAGVRAQRTGISLSAAHDCFASFGRPLSQTFAVEGVQPRSPRQVVERAALNPYRSQPEDSDRAAAVAYALGWAESHVGPVDEPVNFRVVRVHHVYRARSAQTGGSSHSDRCGGRRRMPASGDDGSSGGTCGEGRR